MLPNSTYATIGELPATNVNNGPSKGPLHGVASSVVNIPLKNAPPRPSSAASALPADCEKPGIGISHTPRKLSAIANVTRISATLNHVYVNCSPQNRLTTAASVASARKTAMMPKKNQR